MEQKREHPLDVVVQVVVRGDWGFERMSAESLVVYCDTPIFKLQMPVTWLPSIEVLQIGVVFDFVIPDHRVSVLDELLGIVNEHLVVGHFAYDPTGPIMTYRHGHVVADTAVTPKQARELLRIAQQACERYYPAFDMVGSNGVLAVDAFRAASMDTGGSA